MVKTSDFRTRTINIRRQNAELPGCLPVAMDVGYSGNKVFGPKIVTCFPSYAKKLESECFIAGEADPNEMLYKDGQTGETWVVGMCAQNLLSIKDTKDSEMALYGRNRYDSPIFRIVSETGIALASTGANPRLLDNIYLQTGLPPTYLKQDREYLKDALAGQHTFDLKVKEEWKHYDFTIQKDHIFIMPQLMGTYLSVSMLNDGNYSSGAGKLFKSRNLLADPGFGTFDLLSIKENMIEGKGQTFDNLGMREVLKRTSDEIFDRYGTDIPVPSMQKFLETGTVPSFDRASMKAVPHEFADILGKYSAEVCDEAICKMKEIYNYLVEHDTLIVTGGTGAAWRQRITEHFKGMQTLEIIQGNQNDTLPYIFSNVRGYYLYLINYLKHQS